MTLTLLYAIGIIALIIGIVWGRAFGGWLDLSKTALRLIGVAVTSVPAWFVFWDTSWQSIDLFGFAFSIPMLVIPTAITALVFAHMSDGHRYDRPWKILLRYGWAPILLALIIGYWPLVLIGPVAAGAAALCRMLDLPGIWLPWDTKPLFDRYGQTVIEPMQMFDGWASYWESFTRGFSVSLIFVAPLASMV